MEQADDFLEDSRQLLTLMQDKSKAHYSKQTQFKNWTINDVIGHIHIFNFAANLSLTAPKKFLEFILPIKMVISNGCSSLEVQKTWLAGASGPELLEKWWSEVEKVSYNFSHVDPKQRLKWVGPDMSARSSITARQMETWAHGHEIFDVLGKERVEHDRIKNIVHLGIATFEWTFKNRRLPIPRKVPFVKLLSPSGKSWEWNTPSETSRIEGTATDFVSVVTQTRNVLDTDLKLTGKVAKQWLSIAQCFAGPPEEPPKKNTRYKLQN